MNESDANSAMDELMLFARSIRSKFDGCENKPTNRQDTMSDFDAHSAEDELKMYVRAVRAKPISDMTTEETIFANMYHFWQASILNSGDVAGRFAWLDARRVEFEAIGANGCLKAIEALRPHHEKAVLERGEEGWEWGDEDFRQLIESLEEPAFEDDWEELLLNFGRAKLRQRQSE